jgi:hypothetical protein
MPDSAPAEHEVADRALSGKRHALRVLRVVVTLGAFAYLASVVELQELLGAFARVPASAFLEILAWFSFALWTGAFRWGLLMTTYGAPRRPGAARLLRLYMVGFFYNTFLPGGVGGDVVRGVATREAFGDGGATAGLSVVLVERVMGMTGLILLVAGVTLLHPMQGVPAAHLLGLFGLLGAAGAVLALIFARRLAPALPGPLGRLAAMVPVPQRWSPFFVVLVFAVVAHLAGALGGHSLISAMAPGVELSQSLVIIPVALASQFVPITVSGAGVREAAFVTLFGAVGVPEGAALATSLGMWGCQLALAGIGGVMSLFGERGK